MAATDEYPPHLLDVKELLQRRQVNVFAAVARKHQPGVLAVQLVVMFGSFLERVARRV